jgi:ketosteroid isomerase-like protein
MPIRSKVEIVRSVFDAYKSKDRELIEQLLADDFTFTSPYDDAIDRTTYFERCWPNSKLIQTHVLEKIFEHGDEVWVLYRCMTTDGKEFRNVEVHSLDAARIRHVDVYFGPAYRDGTFVAAAAS